MHQVLDLLIKAKLVLNDFSEVFTLSKIYFFSSYCLCISDPISPINLNLIGRYGDSQLNTLETVSGGGNIGTFLTLLVWQFPSDLFQFYSWTMSKRFLS